jgi:histidinol-phosphate aminotransferase
MSVDIRKLVRRDFDSLDEYTPVKPLDVLAKEIGVPVERLVKLDANENLYGPIPEIREAVASANFHIYPDPGQNALREAIAEYAGVAPDQVVAGAGADDLIDVLLRIAQPSAIVDVPPTFGMYGFLAKINGAKVMEVTRLDDFRPDIPGIRAAVEDGAKVVFLASPNNPTGNPLSHDEVREICGLEAFVAIDEAYIEFGGESAVPLLAEHPNLVILRTFSKWAGLAGLRVGYSLSSPEVARMLMQVKQPYNVNVAADMAARVALEHRGRIFETVKCIVAERERMSRAVGELGWLEPLPSQSNFVLFRVKGRDADEVTAQLRRKGVLVRHYRRPELAEYIRISAGRPEDTDRLLEALRSLEAA